ncbi:MAG: helix-turn-helix domain containing protein [Candidatus Binatia bacterium]|nr:helix-turn-helix domain containing protein [Candidatus Binatia bacterium]
MSSDKAASALPSPASTSAQSRIIGAALILFGEHGISGTSLQMIADEIGVTKAAVYHQYSTKGEIVLAVAQVILSALEGAVTAAEAERSMSRGRDVLITGMIDLAVARRRMAGILQRDPVMLRFLSEHEPFRRVMERVYRMLMGGGSGARAQVQVAMLTTAIGGAVIHPLVEKLADKELRSHMQQQAQRLLP